MERLPFHRSFCSTSVHFVPFWTICTLHNSTLRHSIALYASINCCLDDSCTLPAKISNNNHQHHQHVIKETENIQICQINCINVFLTKQCNHPHLSSSISFGAFSRSSSFLFHKTYPNGLVKLVEKNDLWLSKGKHVFFSDFFFFFWIENFVWQKLKSGVSLCKTSTMLYKSRYKIVIVASGEFFLCLFHLCRAAIFRYGKRCRKISKTVGNGIELIFLFLQFYCRRFPMLLLTSHNAQREPLSP